MLSAEDQDFMSNEMSISLESISSKLGERALLPYRDRLEFAIAFLYVQFKFRIKLDIYFMGNHSSSARLK
ncbi:hypothetical protein X970_01625 [Pseudomonas monteilii SB3101]|uniref:Uncharacterized protein n=1 Tax=Pseudomonas monteilii SB3101 TaxID=1435058 RepID=V9V650_9PSED|nr:hypothetical protein X969_01635 [Pseudomonas monteilii SB3078]AHC91019.1 hypothetical protein X970_01625 [Pseudomonas monteilii SB3101]KGK23636.1 hypothetical protein GT93_01845 [Pseudomonas plecoglossicida]